MEDFVILHIEGKKSIKHKRDNESIVEEIKKSRCMIMKDNIKDSIIDYKMRDNVNNASLVSMFKIYKIQNEATGMFEIKVDVYLISDFKEETSKFNEQLMGTITSRISELDKKLINLIDFGTGISRKDIVQIRRFITDNIRDIPLDQDDIKLKEDFVEKVMTYIVKQGMKIRNIRDKSLYLIPINEFEKQFSEPKLALFQRYMRSEGMIITSDEGRFKYRRNDNEYFFAVNAEHETIIDLYEKIKGKM